MLSLNSFNSQHKVIALSKDLHPVNYLQRAHATLRSNSINDQLTTRQIFFIANHLYSRNKKVHMNNSYFEGFSDSIMAE